MCVLIEILPEVAAHTHGDRRERFAEADVTVMLVLAAIKSSFIGDLKTNYVYITR